MRQTVDAVLLHGVRQHAFVTIDHKDFWNRIDTHHAYCVVRLRLPTERVLEVSRLFPEGLRRPEYSTKNLRVVRHG